MSTTYFGQSYFGITPLATVVESNPLPDNPTFGVATLPFPDEATISPLLMFAEHTTLGGKTRRDIINRKYQYFMRWEYMSVARYEALEAIVNTLTPETFSYMKWPQSENGIECLGTLSARRLTHGVGNDEFWSSVSLTLIEVDNRI